MADERLRIFIEAFDRASLSMDGVAKKLGVMAAGYLSLQGVMQAYRVAVSALHEAEAAAAEDVRLSVAMRLAHIETIGATAAIRDLNAELARNTTFTDDAIARAQAFLISLGHLRGEGLERATRAAANLAAFMGTDITEAARQVALATDGTSRAFQLLNVAITDSMSPAEKYEALLQAIEKQMGNVAKEVADVQPWAQWSKAISEANESLGRFIGNFHVMGGIASPTVNQMLGAMTEQLNKLNQAASATPGGGTTKTLADQLADVDRNIGAANDAARALAVQYDRVTAARPTDEEMSSWAIAAKKAADDYVLSLGVVEFALAREKEQAGKAFIEFFSSDFVDMGGATEAVNNYLEALNTGLDLTNAKLIEQHEFWQEIRTDIQQTAAGAVANFAGALVSAFLQGEMSFGKMLKQMLIGLAAAIVQALVLRAILAALNSAGPAGVAFSFGAGAASGMGGGNAGGGRGAMLSSGEPVSLAPAAMVGGFSMSVAVLGTTPAFIRNSMDMMNTMARQEGYQFSAEVVGG